MAELSPRLGLPLLAAGQAQKEIMHNEALMLIDALTQPVAVSAGTNHPPADPAEGACWIIGDAPDAEWTGQAQKIALRSAGGWRFVMPRDGMSLWVADRTLTARYLSGAWTVGAENVTELTVGGVKVVGEQQPAIADPSGGTTVDGEARATILALLVMLKSHGLIAS